LPHIFMPSLRHDAIINLNEDAVPRQRVARPASPSWELRPLKFYVTQATSINENRLPIRTGAYTSARVKSSRTHTHTHTHAGDGYVSFDRLIYVDSGDSKDTLVPLRDEYPYSYPFDKRARS